MYIESIGYLAMLLEYIASTTGNSVKSVAEKIGEDGIARLCHNAPMNRLLPIKKISQEVIHDYEIPGTDLKMAIKNDMFGDICMGAVKERTSDKKQFVHVFYEMITGEQL